MASIVAKKEALTVLVVDDSSDVISMLNDVLVDEGLTTLIALNGEQALTITSNFIPDIILLDAVMPGIDGFETARRLLENSKLKDTPIIFMTGLSDTENIVKGFESGCTDYITKPIINAELIARMRSHLKKSQLTQSAKNALDTSGKHLIACDSQGGLLWATPECQGILEQTLPKEKNKEHFADKVISVIQGGTISRITARISCESNTYELLYVGSSASKEHLLQIIELTEETDIDRIKKSLSLTQRESEVLFWLSKGKTNRDIGLVLTMSPRTVNKHLEQIYKKIEVDNRTAAASVCINQLNTA